MWQIYALIAEDILADRRREADAARLRHQAKRTARKGRRPSAGIFFRLVTGRDPG